MLEVVRTPDAANKKNKLSIRAVLRIHNAPAVAPDALMTILKEMKKSKRAGSSPKK